MTAKYPAINEIPAAWLRAILRAQDEGIRTFRLTNGDYTATSITGGGLRYVSVRAGKIVACDCPTDAGKAVCKHKGAVARRLLEETFGEYQVRQVLAQARTDVTPARKGAA